MGFSRICVTPPFTSIIWETTEQHNWAGSLHIDYLVRTLPAFVVPTKFVSLFSPLEFTVYGKFQAMLANVRLMKQQ